MNKICKHKANLSKTGINKTTLVWTKILINLDRTAMILVGKMICVISKTNRYNLVFQRSMAGAEANPISTMIHHQYIQV